ncbi:hypothetical protein SAMN04488001_3093 [Litoreibacter albidus]|uniref:MAE-28990/MAE-18760-like HEPN domain-containing protein n=2 Tax=Litoreibacter albidus TaxID=670155 RepID=A0A1H3B958_9RHOB|nr:hypothetical protein SAMN04488001_3093 [Litoreibacter albidus]
MGNYDAEALPENSAEVVKEIISLNAKLSAFWTSAHGWAPDDAANLLSKSRLDWQVSLSETLHLWIDRDPMTDGELILAWANLGALLEGTLKLFFSIYYSDFQADTEALVYANAYDKKKKTHKEPDGLTLDILRKFVVKEELFNEAHREMFQLVQSRRNAIHAYEDRELGTVNEFRDSVRGYRKFLTDVDLTVPYPDYP